MKNITKQREVDLNKSIAYFMGWRIDNSFPDKEKVWKKGNYTELDTTLKFSSDWNALMEVYHVIINLKGLTIQIEGHSCCIFLYGKCDWKFNSNSPLEAIFLCIGEFIEFYNKSQIKTN